MRSLGIGTSNTHQGFVVNIPIIIIGIGSGVGLAHVIHQCGTPSPRVHVPPSRVVNANMYYPHLYLNLTRDEVRFL